MRCYVVLMAGALFGVAGTLAQEAGSSVTNVIPEEAMKGAIFRAVSAPKVPQPLTTRPSTFRISPTTSNVCAIPLLEARGTPTHDRIEIKGQLQRIDPKMALAPRVPACPNSWFNQGTIPSNGSNGAVR
jgi:hypothetical protein